MTQDGIADPQLVSRETREDLDHYLALLRKWNRRINLVSPQSLAEAETRHIQDSLQILPHLPARARRWADLGSGGGFPGMVLAIAAKQQQPETEFHLVESDQRKAVFLRTVSRETSTPVTIHNERIEELAPLGADIVSARALAPLPVLLGLVSRHLTSEGSAILPKGADHAQEIAAAKAEWAFHYDALPSRTLPDSILLKVRGITHV